MFHSNRIRKGNFHARRQHVGGYVDMIEDYLNYYEELLENDTDSKHHTHYYSDKGEPGKEYHEVR